MVRMEPGAVYPAHRHTRTEQCLILEGDVTHRGHTYHPGDFTWAEAGTIDPSLETVNGNLLLIITGIDKETPV
jgi:anti-sigma factor ChrR (cupin superfamily)